MTPHIFRVGELTRALKDVIEGQFPFVWVRGQVSNLARPASGHVYFSLGDGEGLLPVVWFKGSQQGLSLDGGERYDPLTGEVLEGGGGSAWLSDGADVLCAGRLTAYTPRGQYQMVAELVQDMGLGRLYLEFEAMKQRLAALGWFDQERKRPLPPDPKRVAVVTAPTGAAVRDFLKVGSTRGTGCEIRIFPTLVQGEAAPGQIAEALDAAVSDGWAQMAVLIRGGGSIEDLWAFNTEEVAAAVVRCPVPVVCGVGHEVDVTIADLCADVRAATPSHAAQILWPERSVLAQRADEAEMALSRSYERFLASREESLAVLWRALGWLSPSGRVERMAGMLADLSSRCARAGKSLTDAGAASLDGLAGRLERSGAALTGERAARLDGLAGRLAFHGPERLKPLDASLLELVRRLDAATGRLVESAYSRLDLAEARLAGANPSGPLERGYALARKADGSFLRSAGDVRPGDMLDIIVRDGSVRTEVKGAGNG